MTRERVRNRVQLRVLYAKVPPSQAVRVPLLL